MFKKGRPPLHSLPGALDALGKAEFARMDALIEKAAGTPGELERLASIAKGSADQDERHEALVIFCAVAARTKPDTPFLEMHLSPFLDGKDELLANLASSSLAGRYIAEKDIGKLLALASHARMEVRCGAVCECELQVLGFGYDPRFEPVFAIGILDDDPDVRKSAVSALSNAGGDVRAAMLLAAANARDGRRPLDS